MLVTFNSLFVPFLLAKKATFWLFDTIYILETCCCVYYNENKIGWQSILNTTKIYCKKRGTKPPSTCLRRECITAFFPFRRRRCRRFTTPLFQKKKLTLAVDGGENHRAKKREKGLLYRARTHSLTHCDLRARTASNRSCCKTENENQNFIIKCSGMARWYIQYRVRTYNMDIVQRDNKTLKSTSRSR